MRENRNGGIILVTTEMFAVEENLAEQQDWLRTWLFMERRPDVPAGRAVIRFPGKPQGMVNVNIRSPKAEEMVPVIRPANGSDMILALKPAGSWLEVEPTTECQQERLVACLAS